MKPCRVCAASLPPGAFASTPANRDGRANICRECKRDYDASRAKAPTHPRKYTIDSEWTDGSRCEMTRRSLRLARAFGAQLYHDSKYTLRVVVRGRKTIYEDWNRYPQQEATL